MRISRAIVGLPLAIAAVGWPAATLAAPAPFEGLPADCAGIGETILTAPGNGTFTPGFIEDTHQHLVPHVVDVTVTGPDGSTRVSEAKAAPEPRALVVCTVDFTFHIGGATYTIVGSLSGVVVGKP